MTICKKISAAKELGRGGKKKGCGENEFPPRPSEFLEIGVRIFSVESPNFFQQTPQVYRTLTRSYPMSDYFFIEQENMPCIYELSFDAKTPAVIVRAHEEFM
ncbi:MAG: hypothetical protein AAB488_01070, partial [Patescibacteria group bacterium]